MQNPDRQATLRPKLDKNAAFTRTGNGVSRFVNNSAVVLVIFANTRSWNNNCTIIKL